MDYTAKFILGTISSDGYIVCNKDLMHKLGINEAILLGELASENNYWDKRTENYDGWFFSTTDNIEKNTALSKYQQNKAASSLVKAGILEIAKKGMPARNYYRISIDGLINFLSSKKSKNLTTSSQETKPQVVKKLDTNNNKKNNENINPPTPQGVGGVPKAVTKTPMIKSKKIRFEVQHKDLVEVRDRAYDLLSFGGIPTRMNDVNEAIVALSEMLKKNNTDNIQNYDSIIIDSFLDYLESDDYAYQLAHNPYCPRITRTSDLINKFTSIREIKNNKDRRYDPDKTLTV